MIAAIPPTLAAALFVPVPRDEKVPASKWRDVRLSMSEVMPHLAAGGNLALRVGRDSGAIVDADLDCTEALELADLYLPPTDAIFGRASKPRSHWLYVSKGAVYATFGDPVDGSTLAELRADGRDGGAHLTIIPPSITSGEPRHWENGAIEPAVVDAAVLQRRMAWLAIGCLVSRHVSRHAAQRPGPDLPAILWEADRQLGRAAYRWLGEPAPDEPRRSPKPRAQMSDEELDLAAIVAAISNTFCWEEWNRLGMAIYGASGGSDEGFVAFDDLSSRSPKYRPYAVRERWRNYAKSPPSRIGLGTLIHLARQAGWQRRRAA